MKKVFLLVTLLCALALLFGCNTTEPTPTPAPTAPPTATPTPPPAATATATPGDPGTLSERATLTTTTMIPALATRTANIQAALSQPNPILKLGGDLNEDQVFAQEIAVASPAFQQELFDQAGRALRSEIFGIYPTRASDNVGRAAGCAQSKCYRVEMYNYAYNLATVGIVDTFARSLVAVSQVPDTQPDIPPALTELAVQIAVNSPLVAGALGVKPGDEAAMMPNSKTALNASRCERSHHLCVAPTFQQGDRALWAIVDLTDGVLVGTRWTDLGPSNAPASGTLRITEKTLQNDIITKRFCETTTQLEQEGWSMAYILTSSDGLRLSDVTFKGQPVLTSAKLVDWHVSYSGSDGFGYSDAIGCPVFSQAAVVAFAGPHTETLREGNAVVGFVLVQDFYSELWPLPCNYNYQQRYEFYNDGRFRVVAGNLGRGCGKSGTYRPVIRLELPGQQTVADWDGASWQPWETEQWKYQRDGKLDTAGYGYRVTNAAGDGYYIQAGKGRARAGEHGDNALLFVTKHHADVDEGDADLVTIGPCCNSDYRQGPEKFIEPTPESLANSELVLWYVAQIENDMQPGQEYCWADFVLENGVYVPKAWPCYAGPLFVPIKK